MNRLFIAIKIIVTLSVQAQTKQISKIVYQTKTNSGSNALKTDLVMENSQA